MEKSTQSPAQKRSNGSREPPTVGCKDDEAEAADAGCGWGRFRPAILEPLAHVRTFIVLYIVFAFFHGVNGSYGVAVLTTMERRFNFSSKLAGFVISTSIVGYLVSIIFVSFFLTKTNKPRLFACSMFVTAIGAFLYMLPHLVYGTGNDAVDAAHAQRSILVNSTALTKSGSAMVQLCADSAALGGTVDAESTCSAAERLVADEGVSPMMPVVVMFIISEILHGIAGAPILTLGVAFIDDHTDPQTSAKLVGLMYTVRFMSPIAAFAMGGYFLTIYANLNETDLTPQHPQWIGAWWLGFLVTTIANFVICIPTSMLPKKFRTMRKSSSPSPSVADSPDRGKKCVREEEHRDDGKEKEEVEEDERREDETTFEEEKADRKEETEDEVREKKEEKKMESLETAGEESSSGPNNESSDTSSTSWKEFPKAVRRLVTNPIYMLALTCTCIDWYALGFLGFLPKYFEVHFQKTASFASLFGGLIPKIFASFSSYLGGVVSGKIKGIDGGVAGLCGMNFTLSLITLLLIVPAMFLSCPDVPYSGQVVNNRLNLTTDCNANCGCSSNAFDPVCGSDGLLYFSPCHAGCTRLANSTANPSDPSGRLVRSEECSCVAEAEERSEDGRGGGGGGGGVVFGGFCDNSCASMIPYVVTLIAIFITNNLNNASDTGIVLRSIRKEDKSFALGFKIFCIAISVLPSTIVYGSVFDSSCILKKTTSCTNNEGACLLYDRHALRLSFHGLAMAIKSMSTIVIFVTYLVARRKRSLLTAQQKDVPKLTECA